jgi:hypothetical protein
MPDLIKLFTKEKEDNMKLKKLSKKLDLNKQSIAQLTELKMGIVKGGAVDPRTQFTGCATWCHTACGWTCDSCDPTFIPNHYCICS